MEYPANYGRDHKLVSRLLAQKMADAMFAFAVAIGRRGVKIAYPGIPGGLQGLLGLFFADSLIEIS